MVIKFNISHGIFNKECIKSFQLFGWEWNFDEECGNKWIEIYILGFILYFELIK